MAFKLGLINVGQGPRIDNRSFVRNYFKAQGVDVEILEHASYEDLTYEQIAGMEGCTKRAVKFSVDIAVEKLKKFFKNF